MDHEQAYQMGYERGHADAKREAYFNTRSKRLNAIRSIKASYTWKGVRMCLRRTYPPPHTGNTRPGWLNLLIAPDRIKRFADAVNSGTFT